MQHLQEKQCGICVESIARLQRAFRLWNERKKGGKKSMNQKQQQQQICKKKKKKKKKMYRNGIQLRFHFLHVCFSMQTEIENFLSN
jgi:hypothetical protein